jgi:pimeloyl-ACP methyl ester carboxylesterase
MEELMPAQQDVDVSKPAVVFSQSTIETDGFSIPYAEAGQGDALVCLQESGLRLSRAHELIAQRRHLIALETSGLARSSARATSLKELAHTMHTAVSSLGIDHFSILANSVGARLALWMAIAQPRRVPSVVLLASTATPLPPGLEVKPEAPATHVIGPHSDDEFEVGVSSLETPVLALVGTNDPAISSATAPIYREKLRNFHLVMVYDAGTAMDAERPEAVAAVVDDFLTREGSFIVRNKSGIIYP